MLGSGSLRMGEKTNKQGKMDEKVTYSQSRRSNTYVCPKGCLEDKRFPFHLPESVALVVARIPAP